MYEQFVDELDVKLVASYYDRITTAYQQVPSTEIWTNDILNPILNLLEYYVALDSFEDVQKTVPFLFKQLIELIEHVEKNAERGWKEYNGKQVPFNLYLSPLSIGNDFMIAKRNVTKVSVIKLHTINSLFTDNSFFNSEMEKWLADVQSKSLSITGASARERFNFFKDLKNKVYDSMKKVEKKK